MASLLDSLNPFSFGTRNPSNVTGAVVSGGSSTMLPSSAEQLARETAFQNSVYQPRYLPLFGPQVPSMTVGYVTNAVPSAAFDAGLPGARDFATEFAGRAARYTNDFMTQPYTYNAARDEDLTPFGLKLKQWWGGLTSKLSNPFTAGPTGSLDSAKADTQATDLVKIGAVAMAATAVGVVAVSALSKGK